MDFWSLFSDAKMGLELNNLQLDNDEDIAKIRSLLLENGVIVLRSPTPYQLSRKDQVDFTQRLGDVIKLPHSFEGNVSAGLSLRLCMSLCPCIS